MIFDLRKQKLEKELEITKLTQEGIKAFVIAAGNTLFEYGIETLKKI